MEIQKVLKCFNFFTLTLPPTLAQPSHMNAGLWVVKLSTNVCKLVDVKLGHRCKDHNRRAVWLAEILKATHQL